MEPPIGILVKITAQAWELEQRDCALDAFGHWNVSHGCGWGDELNEAMAGWWFGCHPFYFPIQLGISKHPN